MSRSSSASSPSTSPSRATSTPTTTRTRPTWSARRPPPDGYTYFGVFFEVQNESDEPQTLPSTLTITDADDERFEVLPSESLYALHFGGEVESQEQIPVLDSTAELGAIEGSVAVFLLPESGLGRTGR